MTTTPEIRITTAGHSGKCRDLNAPPFHVYTVEWEDGTRISYCRPHAEWRVERSVTHPDFWRGRARIVDEYAESLFPCDDCYAERRYRD